MFPPFRHTFAETKVSNHLRDWLSNILPRYTKHTNIYFYFLKCMILFFSSISSNTCSGFRLFMFSSLFLSRLREAVFYQQILVLIQISFSYSLVGKIRKRKMIKISICIIYRIKTSCSTRMLVLLLKVQEKQVHGRCAMNTNRQFSHMCPRVGVEYILPWQHTHICKGVTIFLKGLCLLTFFT